VIELANQLFQGKEKFERIHTSGVKGRELTGALKDARRDESSRRLLEQAMSDIEE